MVTPEFIIYPPSKLLEPYIHFYFQQRILGNKKDNPLLYKQTTLPTGCTFLGFNFSGAIDFESWNESIGLIDYPIFFSGQHDSLYAMGLPENTDLFGVVLRPTATSRLTKMPINELRNSAMEADYHISKHLKEVHEKMLRAPFADRIEQFEQWFSTFIGSTRQDAVFTDWAVEEILKRKGIITTRTLAKELKVSKRHLQRSFKERIGLCPHKYAAIVKINHIINDFNRTDTFLIDLLDHYQYYDKSHFRKQFRALTQTTFASYLGSQNQAAQTFLNRIAF